MEGDLVVDDCEFWLPPQFLTDDDLLMDFKQTKCSELGGAAGGGGFNSGPSSPVDSVLTETESDEDDYITMLTRKMAHSTLDEHVSKGWGFSGSPKSPLCGGFGGTRSVYGSGTCSPRRCSNVSSSTTPPAGLKKNEAAWDLLCAAAGEVSRMKMAEESAALYHSRNGLTIPPVKPGPVSFPPENSRLGAGSNQPRVPYQLVQAAWFEQLRRQQVMEQHNHNGNLYLPNLNPQRPQRTARNGVGPAGSSWNIPPPQTAASVATQSGSGMRAVFLGNPGARRECAGTGVFLPRRVGSSTETRKKKSACSTVLLPDRVVHALNLNLEAIDTAQPQLHHLKRSSSTPPFVADCDGALKYKQNLSRASHGHSMMTKTTTMAAAVASWRAQPLMNNSNNSQELRLPQEWTY